MCACTSKDKAPLSLSGFSIDVYFDALTCIELLFQCRTLLNQLVNFGRPRFCEASPPRFASLGQQKVLPPKKTPVHLCKYRWLWRLGTMTINILTCCLTWVPSVDSIHRQLHGFCVLQLCHLCYLCYLYKPPEAAQVLQPGAEKHRNSGSYIG